MKSQDKILVIDASIAGISGDMFLAALMDLGAKIEILHRLSKVLPRCMDGIQCIEVKITDTMRRGFRAKRVLTKIIEKKKHRYGNELVGAVECVSDKLELSLQAKRFAMNATKTLIEIEAKIHESSPNDVHLHEVGSADTILDIVGSAMALDDLGLYDAQIYALPIALGGGKIRIEHGIVSCPAPATLEILKNKGLYVIGGPVESELTTPTGATILANLAVKPTLFYPLMKVERIGYGAGSRDFDIVPNILRLVVGSLEEELSYEEIVMLETDVDDVTGEILGHLIDRLMSEGAKDVTLIPTYRKKNRPGHLIRVITDNETYLKLVKVIMEETGTLGVRYIRLPRLIVPIRRKIPLSITINGRKFTVEVKVSKDLRGKVIAAKPEYESLRKIAQETKIPLRRIAELVYEKINETLIS